MGVRPKYPPGYQPPVKKGAKTAVLVPGIRIDIPEVPRWVGIHICPTCDAEVDIGEDWVGEVFYNNDLGENIWWYEAEDDAERDRMLITCPSCRTHTIPAKRGEMYSTRQPGMVWSPMRSAAEQKRRAETKPAWRPDLWNPTAFRWVSLAIIFLTLSVVWAMTSGGAPPWWITTAIGVVHAVFMLAIYEPLYNKYYPKQGDAMPGAVVTSPPPKPSKPSFGGIPFSADHVRITPPTIERLPEKKNPWDSMDRGRDYDELVGDYGVITRVYAKPAEPEWHKEWREEQQRVRDANQKALIRKKQREESDADARVMERIRDQLWGLTAYLDKDDMARLFQTGRMDFRDVRQANQVLIQALNKKRDTLKTQQDAEKIIRANASTRAEADTLIREMARVRSGDITTGSYSRFVEEMYKKYAGGTYTPPDDPDLDIHLRR